MRSYNFTADAVSRIRGYVEADNEEEAKRLIKEMLWDDLFDEDLDEPISNIKITGYDDLD